MKTKNLHALFQGTASNGLPLALRAPGGWRRWRGAVIGLAWLGLFVAACEGSKKAPSAASCVNDADCAGPGASHCIEGKCSQCAKDADCDGTACIDGGCAPACDSHFDCSPSGLCKAAAVPYCVASDPSRDGQFYRHCSGGASECDRDAGFICLGSGAGDIDAYCSTDCSTDSDCPSGFRCGTQGVTPCANTCGVGGKNSAGCAPLAEIGPGKRFECAEPLGVVQHVCLLRSFCDSCQTDEDCLGVPGQICARDQSGEKICTQICDPGVDSCPWGDASTCGQFDSERGVYTCAHRYGSCHGEGKGCDPCRDRSDCAPTGFCTRTSFTGEQFCIDLSVECDCGSDADASGLCDGHGCPESAGGLAMSCASGSRYDGTVVSHRCVGASSSSDPLANPRAGCWQAR